LVCSSVQSLRTLPGCHSIYLNFPPPRSTHRNRIRVLAGLSRPIAAYAEACLPQMLSWNSTPWVFPLSNHFAAPSVDIKFYPTIFSASNFHLNWLHYWLTPGGFSAPNYFRTLWHIRLHVLALRTQSQSVMESAYPVAFEEFESLVCSSVQSLRTLPECPPQ
jgi:hypothetical protein